MSGRLQRLQSAAAMPDVPGVGAWPARLAGSLFAEQPAASRVEPDADGDARDAAGGRGLGYRDAQGLSPTFSHFGYSTTNKIADPTRPAGSAPGSALPPLRDCAYLGITFRDSFA